MPEIIIVSGEEEFLVERAAREEARNSLANYILEFQFPDQDVAYQTELNTPLLFSEKRAFILWGVKELPYIPTDNEDVFVLVSDKKPIKHPKAKRVLEFPKLKSYSNNNEVIAWILKEGQRFNIDLTRIASALFLNSGHCLRKLSSEIEKIAGAVPPSTIVQPENAKFLMCFSAELTPKEIVESICEGHTSKALAYYDRLQQQGEETGWIIAYMQRHVLQQIQVKSFLERNMSNEESAAILGVPVFIYKKIFLANEGLWSEDSLKQSINTLCDLDIAHKHGKNFTKSSLELEIIRLSEEARNVHQR